MINDKVVYVYKDSEGIPFYVGMGDMFRAYSMQGRNIEFLAKVEEYEKATGKPCYPDIVTKYLDLDQASDIESYLIRLIGVDNLTNKLQGGGSRFGRDHGFRFYHEDFGIIEATQSEMYSNSEYGINQAEVNQLVNGKRNNVKGWQIQ